MNFSSIATDSLPPSSVELHSVPGLHQENGGSHNENFVDHSAFFNPSRTWPILIIAASFSLTFTCCGLNFAFGVYQELYGSMSLIGPTISNPSTLRNPFTGASAAQIDLIGTLGVSLMTIFAPFASSWSKAFSPTLVTLFGAVLFTTGNVLASFSTRLWHFVLTQGVLLGLGTCFSYIPAVTVAPGWFDRRRGVAMGIVLSGTGVGGVFWAPILRLLNSKIGFRDTLRLSGAVAFVLISASAAVMRWDSASALRNERELGARTRRQRMNVPLVNWRIVRSRKFLAQATGALLQAGAYYTPIYFFSTYSRLLGYSAASGANFIALSNASSAAGKVVLGMIADKFGRLNTLFACTFISAVTALGFWLPSTLSVGEERARVLFVTFSITYGIFAGAYISLFPTALVEIFGVQNFSSVNGFLYMIRGIGSLVGTPTAGILLRGGSTAPSMALGYEKLSMMIGVLMAMAAAAVLWVRLESADFRAWKWRM